MGMLLPALIKRFKDLRVIAFNCNPYKNNTIYCCRPWRYELTNEVEQLDIKVSSIDKETHCAVLKSLIKRHIIVNQVGYVITPDRWPRAVCRQ